MAGFYVLFKGRLDSIIAFKSTLLGAVHGVKDSLVILRKDFQCRISIWEGFRKRISRNDPGRIPGRIPAEGQQISFDLKYSR